jgi:hypothetical protein
MDDIQEAAAALRALANDGTKVTKKTARLRQLMPEIDALQAAGVSHEAILEALNKTGLDLKMGAYSTMLWRIRHGKSKPQASIAPPAPIVVTDGPTGEGSNAPEPGPEEVSEIVETRRRREERARRFIRSDANPLLKQLEGTKK